MNPQIEKAFTYHSVKDGQADTYNNLRNKAKEFAYMIDALVPDSREKSLAMTNLEQAMMWANAGVARSDRTIKPLSEIIGACGISREEYDKMVENSTKGRLITKKEKDNG